MKDLLDLTCWPWHKEPVHYQQEPPSNWTISSDAGTDCWHVLGKRADPSNKILNTPTLTMGYWTHPLRQLDPQHTHSNNGTLNTPTTTMGSWTHPRLQQWDSEHIHCNLSFFLRCMVCLLCRSISLSIFISRIIWLLILGFLLHSTPLHFHHLKS